MAQAMRLGHEYHQRQSPREKEIRRRTFWSCFTIDRLVAFATARPYTLSILNISLRLPCTEQTFMFDEEEEVGHSLQDVIEARVAAPRLGIKAFFLTTMRFWSCMASLHVIRRRQTKLSPLDPESDFCQYEHAVRRWTATLPAKFKWSVENYRIHSSLGQGKLFVATHCLLHHCFIVAHQDYLPHREMLYDGTGDADGAALPLDFRDNRLITTCQAETDKLQCMINQLGAEDARMLEDTCARRLQRWQFCQRRVCICGQSMSRTKTLRPRKFSTKTKFK
jgi:hypothetical protein